MNSLIKKNTIKVFLFIVLSLLIVIGLIIDKMFFYHNIPFDLVAECDIIIDKGTGFDEKNRFCSWRDSNFWHTIRDEKFHPFYGLEILQKADLPSDVTIDTQKYTYVVTYGRQLKQIQYRYLDMKNRTLFLLPKQFVGRVLLGKETTEKIYIYRIRKMDIDCDYHNHNRNVFIEE